MRAGVVVWECGVVRKTYYLQNEQFLEQPWIISSDCPALRSDTPSQYSNVIEKVALHIVKHTSDDYTWQSALVLLHTTTVDAECSLGLSVRVITPELTRTSGCPQTEFICRKNIPEPFTRRDR